MPIKIRRSQRRYRCDVPGCQHRTNYLITKRVGSLTQPMHLCAGCIHSLESIVRGFETPKAEEKPAEIPVTEEKSDMEVTSEPVTAEERAAEPEKAEKKPKTKAETAKTAAKKAKK